MNLKQIDFFQPKTRTYWCNGTGRDTYIYNNNGGFAMKTSKPLENLIRSSSLSRIGKSTISPKQMHYHSNGTGRDQYIVTDEGGFTTQWSPQKLFFSSTLRSYERMPSITSLQKRDFFQECQSKLSLFEQTKQHKIYQQQQFIIEKLSMPKMNYQQLNLMNLNNRNQYEKLAGKQTEMHQLIQPVIVLPH